MKQLEGEEIMCISVCYQINGKTIINTFSQRVSKLPIKMNNSQIVTMSWGRREKENGVLPLGGCLSDEDLQYGKWDKYFPKLVKLPVIKFHEITFEGHHHWFDITEGQFIQGAFLQEKDEKRIYVVVIKPALSNTPYSRWPKIISE